MANLVVTFGNKYVKVVTGIYATTLGDDVIYLNKNSIEELELENSSEAIDIDLTTRKYDKWRVTYTVATVDTAFVVDSIDGVTPTDNDHLLTLIMAGLNA